MRGWKFKNVDMKKLFFILCVLLLSVGIMAQSPVFYTDVFTIEQGDTIFMTAEIPPQFPGGREEMQKFIDRNLQWPVRYNEVTVQGRVVVGFTIERDGSITDIVPRSPLPRDFQEIAIEIVEKMPKWIPGLRNGMPIRVRMHIPILFRIMSL